MTVPPQTSENGSNASFEVVGEPRTAYTIILPQSVSLKSATATLSVTGFQSRPQAGANGKLNRKGVETVYVGATLGAVGFQHPSGKYFGTFLATVVY